jgi:hypothetical protein
MDQNLRLLLPLLPPGPHALLAGMSVDLTTIPDCIQEVAPLEALLLEQHIRHRIQLQLVAVHMARRQGVVLYWC